MEALYNNTMKKIIYPSLLQRYAASYQGFSKPVWLICLATFFNSLGQIIGMFVSLYLHTLGYNIQQIGFVLTIYGAGYLLSSYLCGYFCKKHHPKDVLCFSMLSNSIFITAIIFSHNLIYISAVLACSGFSNCLVRPASVLLINQLVTPQDRARTLGLRRVCINLGLGLTAAICGVLASLSYPLVFIFAGIVIFIAGMSLLLSRTYQAIEYVRTTHAHSQQPLKNSASAVRKFWVIAAAYFMVVIVFNQMRTTYPIYLKETYHIQPNLLASLYFLNSLLIVLIEVPLLSYLARYKQHFLAAVGSLLVCVGFGILPFSHHVGFAYFSCALWSIGEILFYPTILNLMLSTMKTNIEKYNALYQTTYSAGILISPIVGSLLYSIDNGTVLWITCDVIGIVVFFKILRFLR